MELAAIIGGSGVAIAALGLGLFAISRVTRATDRTIAEVEARRGDALVIGELTRSVSTLTVERDQARSDLATARAGAAIHNDAAAAAANTEVAHVAEADDPLAADLAARSRR